MKNSKKFIALLLAMVMVLCLAACGEKSSGKQTNGGQTNAPQGGGSETLAPAEGDVDNGDGTYYNSELGYTYGTTFKSDEPISFSVMFNDNDAYPFKDSWETDGIFKAITDRTNVHMDLTKVNNASYNDRITLDISSGTAPDIIPKMYSDAQFQTGGGIVAVSDWVQYMPNYTKMIEDYDLQPTVDQNRAADGKYYRLVGLKEVALQDYSLLIRDDLFKAAGYDVRELEDDWTWEEFAEVLKGVKAYMVSQGIIDESDYIWSDRWCGATSGYSTGGYLLNIMARSYGVYSTWNAGGLTNFADMYFDADADEFKISAFSDEYKQMMTVIQGMVKDGLLDPETWTQEDTTADNKFYRGETAVIGTTRSSVVPQEQGVAEQLGEGNFELYEVVLPMGTTSYQAERERSECGVCISSSALKNMSEAEFIRMMRFVDWLFYSKEAWTLVKWGVEGETYTVDANGIYSLTPGYFCAGLGIAQTSDDQVDMRLELGYAGGNYMYAGDQEILTSAFSPELQDFYDRMSKYRTIAPVEPHVALSELDNEQMNLWAANFKDALEQCNLRFCMNQADVDSSWDTFIAELQSKNAQDMLDMFNKYYKESK